jgi:hypothetical protein
MLKGFDATDKGLKEFGTKFMEDVDELKNNNTFKIDYIKDGSHKAVTINMFKRLAHGKYQMFEPIDGTEYRWIEACNNGSLYYCKPGTYNCYGYDFKSQYPGILAYKGFEIPFKTGTEMKINNLDKIQMGFYKVRITSNDTNFKKIFAFSKSNVYTHYSVLFALRSIKDGYNVKIELVDKDVNCYVYDNNSKTRGSVIFSKWYDILFGLKEKLTKNILIKTITSSLWGQLARNNVIYRTEEEIMDNEIDVSLEYDTNHKYFVREITNYKNGTQKYHLVESKQPYYMNIARIKPFCYHMQET